MLTIIILKIYNFFKRKINIVSLNESDKVRIYNKINNYNSFTLKKHERLKKTTL